MRTTYQLILLAAAILVPLQEPQDPVKSAAKPAAKAEQDAAVVGKPERHRFEGVYRLTRRVVDGQNDRKPSQGYLAITNRHMFLNLAAPGKYDEYPLLHAGVREWSESRNVVRTVIKLDYFTDGGGHIHTVPAGKQEIRRIDLIRGGVRVYRTDRSWLDFERVE